MSSGKHAKAKDAGTIRHKGPGNYATVPNWVNDRCPKDVWLYTHLRGYYGGYEETFPGLQKIADHFGFSIDTAKRALRSLKNAGAITVTARWKDHGGQTTNLYETEWEPPEVR